MSKQLSMFNSGEDLPLFSGTAQRVDDPAAGQTPVSAGQQAKLDFVCKSCNDTGILGEYAFCWCEAGQAAKATRMQGMEAAPGYVLVRDPWRDDLVVLYDQAEGLIYGVGGDVHPIDEETAAAYPKVETRTQPETIEDWFKSPGSYGSMYVLAEIKVAGRPTFTVGGNIIHVRGWVLDRRDEGTVVFYSLLGAYDSRNTARRLADVEW